MNSRRTSHFVRDARRALRLLAAVLAVPVAAVSCVAPRPAPTAQTPHASRAVLISVDGMSGVRLARLLSQPGKLPAGGLSRLVDAGFFAVRSIPSTPSLTPAAHATHVTGAPPRDTGIVGNAMLDPTRPFGAQRSGFVVPLRAETLCEAARRQGKRVGVMAYPHAAGAVPSRCAAFGMNWVSVPRSRPRLERLAGTSWSPAEASAERSFSPPKRTVLDFPPTSHRVAFVALDSTDDGRLDYDRLRVEPETGAARTITVGDWFAIEVSGRTGRAGAWCKLLTLTPDLSTVEIYMGGIWEADAYPEDFRRAVDARAGFWPGRADSLAFGAQSDRPDIYLEQSDRLTEFLTAANLVALERSDWDLLFGYLSEVDAVEHHFLLADPRQEGFTPERAARFAEYIDQSYAAADQSIARFEKVLTPQDALFVTSDHGMTPLFTELYPDEILRENGFLKVAADGTIDPSSAALAMATSGIAHVHVNRAAPVGTLDAVERLLSGFRIDGESPWDRIARRAQAHDLSLDAPESGDLILLSKPGIALSMRMTPGVTSGPAEEYGGHGYRAAFPDLDATFLAAGPGIARGRVDEISSTRIAARIAAALGIAPPRNAAR